MALARSTDSPSIYRSQREGRMCGEERLWKLSSDCFHFLSKAGNKIAHWMRTEEEQEIKRERIHERALPWQKEEFSTCWEVSRMTKLSMGRLKHR